MFDYDKWQEIFGTIRKNKLRTILTMLGIFWGIFMIIILLGAGNSFQDGVSKDFGQWATNSGFIWGQKTTVSHNGFRPGRYVRFDNSDTELILSRVREILYLAPRNRLGGFRGGNNVTRNNKAGAFTVNGDFPEFNKIQIHQISNGRFINEKDIKDFRKVAVIGLNVKNILFEEDEDPVGEYITIQKVNFQVVGVIKPIKSDGEDEDQNTIHVPFTTFQRSVNYGDEVGWYAYTIEDRFKVSEVEAKILTFLKEKNDISPLDEDAIGHFNLQEEFDEINGMFNGLKYFTWFVGLSTLFAGIIGVSNIMLIIVKERTKEIGIRKSLGATPGSIISLIIQESVFLTLIGGYFALIVALLLLELVGNLIPEGEVFAAPSVSLSVAFGALGLLVIGGAMAGILPAKKAASISPIEAIRNEL